MRAPKSREQGAAAATLTRRVENKATLSSKVNAFAPFGLDPGFEQWWPTTAQSIFQIKKGQTRSYAF
jgi:hypothetical protein